MDSHASSFLSTRSKASKETQGEIARSYNVSRWTISRLAP